MDKFQECNIDKRPAYAFVTKVDAPDATVKKIQDILKAANVSNLKTGGIVDKSVETLVPTNGTAKDYVGSYGKHYNALTDGPACDAASSFVSFSQLVIAIFAFIQLA